MPNPLPRVAIATGDPAGIGPEVGLKAALDPAVAAICRPIVVGDPDVLTRQAQAAGLPAQFNIIGSATEARWPGALNVLSAPMPKVEFRFGMSGAEYGLGALASARAAVKAALNGQVEAVV